MHWFLSLCDFYFRRKILQQAPPLLASFKLTYRCNLACKACPFHQRKHEPRSHMSWDTAMAVLATLKQRGCSIIIFEGGEPLLWSDGEHTLHDLIKYARVHFLRVCITTNGTMPFDVPADGIWVSIDGLRETHNQLRSDSFDMVWENLCASAQSNICIHYTLNRKNYSEIESLLQKLSHIPQVRGMTVQLFYPYERGEEDLRLSDAQCRDALTHVLQLK